MILTESLNLRNFWATEAALLAVMLAYNLMSLFRQAILRSDPVSAKADVQYTLKTLLYELFAKAGYIALVWAEKRSLTWLLRCSNVSGLMAFGINPKHSTFPPNSHPFTPIFTP